MKKYLSLMLAGLLLSAISCKNNKTETPKAEVSDSTATMLLQKLVKDKVLTLEEQKALTPEIVLQSLKEGNKNFRANNLTARDHSALVREAALGQYPEAVVLSCLDSRVPVEDIFDKGIGDLFVARVAGNFVNEDILGSIEYGCKVAGAKLIVVMGHRYCGAVKSAIDDVKLGNITAMLAKIKPAVALSQDYKGEKLSKNQDYVTYVAINNVKNTVEEIKKRSKLLKEMLDKGEIKIVGAGYDLNTGEVIFFE